MSKLPKLADLTTWFTGVLNQGKAQRIPVIGIDISHNKVRMGQLTSQGDRWILSKYGSKSIDPSVVNEEALEMETLRALNQIYREGRFTTDKVAVSIPINTAIVKVINIPLLKDNELKQAVDNGSLWESTIHLPSELSEYAIFWQVVRRDEAKNEMSILFVASKRSQIDHVVDLLAKAGLDALVVDVRCFALRNILKVKTDSQPSNLSVLLEISGDESYVVFVDGDLPFIYDIYISDEDIVRFNLGQFDEHDAIFERLSEQIRTALQMFMAQSGRNTIEVIEYVSTLPQSDVILRGIHRYLQEYRIEEINPLDKVIIPENLKDRLADEKNPSALTACIGMATRQVDVTGYYKFVTAVSNINLLPNREERLEHEKKKTQGIDLGRRLGLIGGLIGAACLLVAVFSNLIFGIGQEVDGLTARLKTLQQQNAQIQQTLTSMNTFTTQRSAHNERFLSLSFLNRLPRGVLVKEIKVVSGAPSQLVLVGRDPAQFNLYVNELLKDPGLSNVRLDSVEASPPQANQPSFQLARISLTVK